MLLIICKHCQFNCKIIFISDVISDEINQLEACSSSISTKLLKKKTKEHKNVISDGNIDLLMT